MFKCEYIYLLEVYLVFVKYAVVV